ncbi:MAG: hypothetical protein V4527_18090 [Pseudomonadota bacterium]
MPTVADVVTTALKLAKIIPSGTTPSADESADGQTCFQSLLDEWVAGGMFGRLTDVYLTGDDTAVEGRRYLLAAGVTLTIPSVIPRNNSDDYGASANSSSERQPYDLSLIESVTSAGVRTVKLYDRTAWVNLLGLTLADAAPLSSRGLTGLAATLACSGAFAAMFDDTKVSPRVEMLSRRFVGSLSGKAGSTHERASVCYY